MNLKPYIYLSSGTAVVAASLMAWQPAESQSAGSFVALQGGTPGTAQPGNTNIIGTAIIGGNVGIGITPASKLHVNGVARMTGFQLTTTPTNGYVLQSNASGVGTWQPNIASGLILPYHGIANVAASDAVFTISNTGTGYAMIANSTVNSSGGLLANAYGQAAAIRADNTYTGNQATGLWATINNSNDGWAIRGHAINCTGMAMGVHGTTSAASGYGVYGQAQNATGSGIGVCGETSSIAGIGVRAISTSNTGVNYGVKAESFSPFGTGVYGFGGLWGVYGASGSVGSAGVFGTGPRAGTYGQTLFVDGDGAVGESQSPTGFGNGVYGRTDGDAGSGVYGYASHTVGSVNGVRGEAISTNGVGVRGKAMGSNAYGVLGESNFVGVLGKHAGSSGSAILGQSSNAAGSANGLRGEILNQSGAGVFALASSPVGVNFGVRAENFSFNGRGVLGFAQSLTGPNLGVFGLTNSDAGYGVYGWAQNGAGTTYGVFGVTSSFAGYGVYSAGNFAASGTKAFRIDHPKDPENKYLLHYCAEGPEPMNEYSGVTTLNAKGEAWISLPEYFDEINKNFRYLLTAVGAPMPNLHVAQKVADNRFFVSGGVAGMEVSWEVKGVRNDRWVKSRGAPTVIEKAENERGKYAEPQLYGLPVEKGIHYQPIDSVTRVKAKISQ